MQVKKFEARNMKDALQMVKTELGPDAIILSAREISNRFGLVGDGSVEITAAISEETLKKKKYAESKMRDEDRSRFINSPARSQREVINKMVNQYTEKNTKKQFTARPYVEIENEEAERMQQTHVSESMYQKLMASTQAGRRLSQKVETELSSQEGRDFLSKQTPTTSRVSPKSAQVDTKEVDALKSEISTLKKMLEQFQTIPQTFQASAQQQQPQSFTQAHPGADYGLNFDVSFMFSKLVDVGIANEIAADILLQAQKEMSPLKIKNKALVEAYVAKHILATTQVVDTKAQNKIHIFMGQSGSGKTSSLVKYASHLLINQGKRVAILTTDTFKIGAIDQLRIYSQILNIPFGVIRNQEDWDNAIKQLHLLDAVLVDFPSFGLKNIEEITLVKKLLPHNFKQHTTHLVMSAVSKDADLAEAAKRYSVVGFQDVIFNNLDESLMPGTIYNFMKKFNIPLHSFGVGNRIPEDFEPATKERVLDLIFKITKIKKAGDL